MQRHTIIGGDVLRRREQQGTSKNSYFRVRARKHRAQNRSVYEIHEDSSTVLTPLSCKKCIFRSAQQMNAVGRSILRIGIEIAEGHHEKYDGSGYPKRLRGNDIPLSARIVTVADVFDALASKRPYKEARPVEKALEYLDFESGKHFDPEVVLAFKQAMPRVMKIYEKHKHI